MKRFRFRLASYQNIKRLQVDELRQALVQRQQELRQAEDRLLGLRAAQDECYLAISQERQGQPDLSVLSSFEAYAGVLRGKMQVETRLVLQLRRELELAQRRLLQRHRELKVLEKLRERQHAEYSLNEQRESQKELDEAARHAHPLDQN